MTRLSELQVEIDRTVGELCQAQTDFKHQRSEEINEIIQGLFSLMNRQANYGLGTAGLQGACAVFSAAASNGNIADVLRAVSQVFPHLSSFVQANSGAKMTVPRHELTMYEQTESQNNQQTESFKRVRDSFSQNREKSQEARLRRWANANIGRG